MSRFNTKSPGVQYVANEAGGTAITKMPKHELVSLVLTSFVNDQYYRSAGQQLLDLERLATECGVEFAAKAAIYARKKFHMRSVTHALAAIIAPLASGKPWARRFFTQIVERPDDITEILSFWYQNRKTDDGKPVTKLTQAMKIGLGRALAQFDEYQLAKYKMQGKSVSLVDAVRLLHPKPTEKNAAAFKALVEGTLAATKTWEAKLSQAGQAETTAGVAEAKAQAWGDLLKTNQLGYFALLRNLRNIYQQAPDALPLALEQLVDPKRIRGSKVLPFRFATAMDTVGALSTQIATALDKAAQIALQNVPVLAGRTLIAVDHSGSMGAGTGKTPLAIASLFGGVLALTAENADLMVFETKATMVPVVKGTPLTVMRDIISRSSHGGGTDFSLIFARNTKYDNVVILSDMMPWVSNTYAFSSRVDGGSSVRGDLYAYRKRTGATPNVFSFDLAGHSTTQFLPADKVFHLAGFSEEVFTVLKKLSEDQNAMVNEVEAITL
jgi:hypothetical protein